MVERGEHGKLKPGSVLNPKGRPKRAEEEQYTAALFSVIGSDRFKRMLERQAAKAEAGNLASFQYICKLMGLEIQKTENDNFHAGSLEITVKHVEINRT